jgi:hypothetical protein
VKQLMRIALVLALGAGLLVTPGVSQAASDAASSGKVSAQTCFGASTAGYNYIRYDSGLYNACTGAFYAYASGAPLYAGFGGYGYGYGCGYGCGFPGYGNYGYPFGYGYGSYGFPYYGGYAGGPYCGGCSGYPFYGGYYGYPYWYP